MNLNLLSSIPLCQTKGKLLDLSLLLSFALGTQSSVTAHCIAYIPNSLGLHNLVPSAFAGSSLFISISFLPMFFTPVRLPLWGARVSCSPSCFNASTKMCEMPPPILSLELSQIKGRLLPCSSHAESVFERTEILRCHLLSSISSIIIKG